MKYIIEIENEPFGRNDDPVIPHGMDELYRAKGFKSLVFDKNGLNKLTPYTEPDRKAVEDEVWEFLEFLFTGMSAEERYKCFNNVFAHIIVRTMSYQEAKSKYEAWLEQKGEICVGDEIYSDGDYEKAIVMEIHGDGSVSVYTKNGCIEHWCI